MAKVLGIYKCEICGNIVEVVHGGGGELVCCNQPMKLMLENSVEASLEKHVPVIEKSDNLRKVKVGSIPHPMEEKHYIEWIEIVVEGKSCRQYLKPGDLPERSFNLADKEITARAYCNLHGLWSAKE
ncbi:MAG: desulfoferrodoxin [Deltaproteobacteria bacterium]